MSFCDLIGLESFCQKGMAGVRCVEYVPTNWVDKAAYQVCIGGMYNQQATIPFLTGKDWLKAPLLVDRKGWTENHTANKQGGFWTWSITGTLAGWQPKGAGELDKMVHLTYLLRLTCRDGQPWIIGTCESPLRFTVNSNTRQRAGELKGHTVRWYGQSKRKATGYLPVF